MKHGEPRSHILAIPDVVKAIVDFKDDPETLRRDGSEVEFYHWKWPFIVFILDFPIMFIYQRAIAGWW